MYYVIHLIFTDCYIQFSLTLIFPNDIYCVLSRMLNPVHLVTHPSGTVKCSRAYVSLISVFLFYYRLSLYDKPVEP